MDVFPVRGRLFWIFFFCVGLAAGCGNRYDLSTERGRQARLDDANFHLSKGHCSEAHLAIDPLYSSPHVDDIVRLVKASAYACDGSFNLLTVVSNLSGASNYFSALAKSLSNSSGDGARSAFYAASDVLTRGGSVLAASQRSAPVNTYMVFLQMGTVGAILRNYGSPATDGAQGAAISYLANGADGAGEMTTLDACALTAALATLSDSIRYSSLTDGDSAAVANSINASCVAAGVAGGCADLNKNRTACTGAGADANSVAAAAVVGEIDSAW